MLNNNGIGFDFWTELGVHYGIPYEGLSALFN